MSISEWNGNGDENAQALTHIVKKRANPGILVFDAEGTLLFINREAHQALDALKKEPLDTYNLYSNWQNLSSHMKKGNTQKRRDESPRFILQSDDPEGAYSLRAFSLNPSAQKNAHLLILVEKVRPQRRMDLTFLEHVFQLTLREQDVVKSLLYGCTNKEIAASLEIEVNTVKDHLKNIMEKMAVTTRTGILSRIVNQNERE